MKSILITHLIVLSATCSCNLTAEKSIPIKGFWECYMAADSRKVLHFCEVTDSVFAFWSEEVNYLPPYLYSIATVDSLFFEGVQGQKDLSSSREFVGVISIIDSIEFQIVSENDTLSFIKSSKEKFERINKNNEKWLDF